MRDAMTICRADVDELRRIIQHIDVAAKDSAQTIEAIAHACGQGPWPLSKDLEWTRNLCEAAQAILDRSLADHALVETK